MSPKVRIVLTVLFLALLAGSLSAIACGSSSSKSNTPSPGITMAPGATRTKAPAAASTKAVTPQTTGTAAAAENATVTIKDFEFTPATVTIAIGGTVTWTNDGPATHDVTADDGSFKSGSLAQGKTYTRTFDTAGTFDYHCGIHPNMKASVIVQ